MAKVFGIQTIELHPHVNEADFERFVLEEVLPLPLYPGWKARLLKGDRGERVGKYVLLIEIDSVEARDRYFPAPHQPSEEAQAFDQAQPSAAGAIWDKWSMYSPTIPGVNIIHTDYVEVTAETST